MIMAIGHCECHEAIPLLHILAHEKFEATMVLVAIGDAYVRLRRRSNSDADPVFEILAIRNEESLLDGALRAMAMLRMSFDEETTASILQQVTERKSERLKFWVAAACPGWSGAAVDCFLESCLRSEREDVRSAAQDARIKKYRKWNPL
jgi:hypothetical protein